MHFIVCRQDRHTIRYFLYIEFHHLKGILQSGDVVNWLMCSFFFPSTHIFRLDDFLSSNFNFNDFSLSKSTWDELPVEDIPIFTCECFCGCVGGGVVRNLLIKRKSIQTWNLVHVLPKTISENGFFVFFEKITPRSTSLEKLPRHVDFPHISIGLLFLIILPVI